MASISSTGSDTPITSVTTRQLRVSPAACNCRLLAHLADQHRLPSHLAVLQLRLGYRVASCEVDHDHVAS